MDTHLVNMDSDVTLSASDRVSNAFNFSDQWSGQVDTRTGTYNFKFNFSHWFANYGLGYFSGLELLYSSGELTNRGLGIGWSFNLSHFDMENSRLKLRGGIAGGKVEGLSGRNPTLQYQQLKDILIKKGSDGYLLEVIYKEGDRELFDHNGYLRKVIGKDGRTVSVYYKRGGSSGIIETIEDDHGNIIEFQNSSLVTYIKLKDSEGGALQFKLLQSSGMLTKIELPDLTQVQFSYIAQGGLIGEVNHPTGSIEKLSYGDIKMPGSSQTVKVVQHYQVIPGEGQPPLMTNYIFDGANGRNYLGWNSGSVYQPGVDNLFERDEGYNYETWEENDKGTVKRIFNKFHLVDQIIHYDKQNKKIVEEKYNYLANLARKIQEQPANYSLPIRIITTYFSDDGTRDETKEYSYDDYGNLLSQTSIDGSRVENVYFPENGEPGSCPADPYGFVNYLKKTTRYPSDSRGGEEPYDIGYMYQAFEKLDGPGHYVQLVKEEDSRGVIKQYEYYLDRDDSVSYGRIARLASLYNGFKETRLLSYEISGNRLVKTKIQSFHDGLSWEEREFVSLYTGLKTGTIDKDGIVSAFSYDFLGRSVEEVTAVGNKDHQAIRSYQYNTKAVNGENSLVITAANGNQVKYSYDGLGRELKSFCNNPSSDSWFLLEEKQYNALGQIFETVTNDQLSGKTVSLATWFRYDYWGSVSETHHPDGSTSYSVSDPVTLTNRKKRSSCGDSLAETTTNHDIRGNEIKKVIYSQGYPSTAKVYDGWGRLVKEIGISGQISTYQYDVISRKINTINPEGTVQAIQYAAHSTEELPEAVHINDTVIGCTRYDGSGRRLSVASASVNSTWESRYSGTSGMPISASLPSGITRTYKNNPYLKKVVTSSGAGIGDIDFTYDRITGDLLAACYDGSGVSFTYDKQGRVIEQAIYIDNLVDSNDNSTLSQEDFSYSPYGERTRLARASV